MLTLWKTNSTPFNTLFRFDGDKNDDGIKIFSISTKATLKDKATILQSTQKKNYFSLIVF